nr:FadR/GntR family transcriptional regulator [Microlunatus panaciterrae]
MVAELTQQIQEGELAPGARLPTEAELAEGRGVSRTVVREALSRLQAAGLVETYRGRGSFVLARPSSTSFDPGSQRSVEEMVELLAFRIGIEVEAAGLAAVSRTDVQLEGIWAALDRLRQSSERPSAAVDADFQFHLRVALASGNRYYGDLISSLGPTMIALPRARLSAAIQPSAAARFAAVCTEHENVAAAIGRREPETARAAVRLHLSNSMERLRRCAP